MHQQANETSIGHRKKHNSGHLELPDAFDYSTLAGTLRKQVQEESDAIRHLLVNTVTSIVQIGLRLQFVRRCLGRSYFQAWLAAEFRWSQSVASNYMRAAAVFANVDCIDRFHSGALYILARHRAPEMARSEAVQRARAGEMITAADAQSIVLRHGGSPTSKKRNPALRLSAMIKDLETLIDDLRIEERQLCAEQLAALVSKIRSPDADGSTVSVLIPAPTVNMRVAQRISIDER